MDKYALTKDFIRRVVDSARNELDLKSPVSFTYTPVKEGRKIAKLIFFPVKHPGNERGSLFFKQAVRRYGIAGQPKMDCCDATVEQIKGGLLWFKKKSHVRDNKRHHKGHI